MPPTSPAAAAGSARPRLHNAPAQATKRGGRRSYKLDRSTVPLHGMQGVNGRTTLGLQTGPAADHAAQGEGSLQYTRIGMAYGRVVQAWGLGRC